MRTSFLPFPASRTSSSRGHHHGLAVVAEFLEQPLLELVGIVDRQRGHHVERATRHVEHHAGDLAELAAERVAALLILVAHGGKILGADGVERGRRDLVERRDRKSCLAVFHRVVHELLILGDQAADTRAAGGKALGDRVDDDDVVTRLSANSPNDWSFFPP